MRQPPGSKHLPAGAAHGRGYDPRMLTSCFQRPASGNPNKAYLGYAECSDAELEPGGRKETARAKFVRELIEKRRAH